METFSIKESFRNEDGAGIVEDLVRTISANKQYLSDIDGAIGDGDHGINMSKGFLMCRKVLESDPGDMTHAFQVLSKVLLQDIGGSMGPLYGSFFRSLSRKSAGQENIDGMLFLTMLQAGLASIQAIGSAELGDKTLLDCLIPAVSEFEAALAQGVGFQDALQAMRVAAARGRDSTYDMVARVGRASRLGERSRGALDAGATSCCLILESMADSISELIGGAVAAIT